MNPKLSFLSEVLTRNARSYYTNTAHKVSLYRRISPLGDPGASVGRELDGWVQKGKKIRVGELQRIIHDLRKRRRFSQALEVSEWMKKKGVCIFTPTEHAVQLDLIGKVHGFTSAESYFETLEETEKTEKTYGALLSCYVRQRQSEKSLSHLQKMKEMGVASSALTYNDIMCLYLNTLQYDKVPVVLAEMKENNVSPDNFSYRICMNSYGARSDIEGMERVLVEMESRTDITMDWNTYSVAANFYIKAGLTDKAIDALKKSEERLDKKDGTAYNHLISLYAALGNKDEVLRLWGRLKSDCKRCLNKDYIVMLEALVRLGELEEVEKVFEEWQSSGNYYDFRAPNTVVLGYAEKGECEKAEALLEDLVGKGKATTSNSWAIVAAKYLEKENTEKALKCMKRALGLYAGKGWKPNPRVTNKLLQWLGDEVGVEDVEEFVKSLRSVVPANKHMYRALLKAYVRAGKETNGVLEQMKSDKIEEDQETKSILAMRQSSS